MVHLLETMYINYFEFLCTGDRFVYSLIYLLVFLFVYLLIHAFTYSFIQSVIFILIYSWMFILCAIVQFYYKPFVAQIVSALIIILCLAAVSFDRAHHCADVGALPYLLAQDAPGSSCIFQVWFFHETCLHYCSCVIWVSY